MGKKVKSSKKSKKVFISKPKSGTAKLAFYALGILFSLLILAKLLGFLTSLNKPISPDLGQKNHQWDGKSAISVAVTSLEDPSQVSVVSYYPKEEKTVVLNLSDQTYIDLPKGYGNWRLGSIYQLGQEESPAIGGQLLKMSLSKLLGLPIEGVILTKGIKDQPEDLVKDKKNPISLFMFISNIKTDLTPLEVFRFSKALADVRADKVISLDLESSDITESKLLADSSRVLGVDTIKLDLFVREKMSDSSLLEEGYPVAIYNATEYQGIAQEASRVVTNLGGNVVMITNTDSFQEKSSVVLVCNSDLCPDKGDKDRFLDSATYKKLVASFAANCTKKRCETQDPKVLASRAQINIILGKDFFDYWYKR